MGVAKENNYKHPRQLWKWVGGPRSHSEQKCGSGWVGVRSIQFFLEIY